MTLDAGHFDGNRVNLFVQTSAGAYPADAVPPFLAVIRNTTHGTVRSGGKFILKAFVPASNAALTARYRIVVERHNGVAGDDFEVYAPEQAQDFVIPAEGYSGGAAGLTNAVAWVQRQTAIFGGVAPCSATHNGIPGFTCASGSVPNIPSIPLTCTPRSSVTDGGGNVWTFSAQKATLRNGAVHAGGWTGYAYVLHDGTVYFLSTAGYWFADQGGSWVVGNPPCRLPTSASGTTLTNYPQFDGGYIIDADGGTWVVVDNPDWPAGSGIKGVVMRNGYRVGENPPLPGCCTILATASPPDHPYAMAFCEGQVFKQRVGSWSRWQGPTVYEWAPIAGVPCGLQGSEFCGDGVDNDNDGSIDEGCPPRPPQHLRLVLWPLPFDLPGNFGKVKALARGFAHLTAVTLRR